jgi:putative aldouronate transport system permease protein
MAMVVIVLYPLVYIVSASISDPVLVNSGQMWLYPLGVTWSGYERVMQNMEIWIGYRNTIFYTLFGVFINLLFTVPGAYALSRKDLYGRNVITFIVVFTMFFSGGLIPNYLLVKELGMLNSVWALVLPTAASVWNIVVCRTFFQSSIPRELQEAAEVDGCSVFRFFGSVVLPLSKPILVVMALFYGVMHWNQYFQALLYISDRNLCPLQLFLREILVQSQISAQMMMNMDGTDYESVMKQAEIADIIKYAVMIVSALPLLIVYPFLQKFFIQWLLIGSLKE